MLVPFAGPVLWTLLGDIRTVERAIAEIVATREWLHSEVARLK